MTDEQNQPPELDLFPLLMHVVSLIAFALALALVACAG